MINMTNYCGTSECVHVTTWERQARRLAKKVDRLHRANTQLGKDARFYCQEMNRQYRLRCKKGEIGECRRCAKDGEAIFSRKDLNLVRQWFDHAQDVGHPDYLGPDDYLLGAKIMAFLGMRIPDSVARHLPGGESDA